MAKPFFRSFAGGVITPEMFGRLDLDKFQTGLKTAKNFEILPHGPARNRSGFQYILEARDSDNPVRVIPFQFSITQTAVIELGNEYARFIVGGGYLLEDEKTVNSATLADPCVFNVTSHGYVVDDWVYLTTDGQLYWNLHQRFMKVATVPTANTFTLTDLHGVVFDASALATLIVDTTVARVYTIDADYLSENLFGIHYAQSADVLTFVHPQYPPAELQRLGATNWQFDDISFVPTVAAPANLAVTADTTGGPGTPVTHSYVVTALSGETFEESLASIADSVSNDLTVTGNSNGLEWDAVTDAVRYNVYKEKNGLYGYIGAAGGLEFTDDNITPDVTQTPPIANEPFHSADDYPGAVTYFEQRRCFAATDNRPQAVWMTRSATESNLSQSVPVRNDDAIIMTLKTNQQNRIRHLAPLGELLAITTGSEHRFFSGDGGELTPASVTARRISSIGASFLQPVEAENALLYVESLGSHIRELANAGATSDGAMYQSNDISILAPHLFDDFEMVDLAFSPTSKMPCLWVARDDGALLGMTYVPGQNVRAWHHHDTAGGFFESVACVKEGNESVLYAVVRREINGRTVRYIERQHTRHFTDIADAFFVDSGLSYDGEATTTITGLWHLEGEAVVALGDGAVFTDLLVTNGQITLSEPCSKVHVGKAIDAQLVTLPLTLALEGFGQGAAKNVNTVKLRLTDSGAAFVGASTGRTVEVRQRTTETYGAPPALFTGWKKAAIHGQWDEDGCVQVTNSRPLPVTVTAMSLDVTPGG